LGGQDGVRQEYGVEATAVRPPRWMLVVAVATAAGAAACHTAVAFAAHVTGYVLGSFATIGFVALFAQIDTRRQQDPFYSRLPWLRTLAAVALTVGVGAAAVHIYFIAWELAARC